MTSAIIIQARMTSSRFPGKVLAMLNGRTVLDRVLDRAERVPGIDTILVAIPDEAASAPLWKACSDRGVAVFQGSETDVLARYYFAAATNDISTIMRITSDCPFFDPGIAGEVMRQLIGGELDYASNVFPRRTYPKGMDCEAFTFDALEAAHLNATEDYDREHVTPWIQRIDGIRIGNMVQNRDHSHINLCVDYPEDIARLEAAMSVNAIPAVLEILNATRH